MDTLFYTRYIDMNTFLNTALNILRIHDLYCYFQAKEIRSIRALIAK